MLDSDIAELYGVETKRINEAVKNNPDKFPDDLMFELSEDEWEDLRSKISTLKDLGRGQHRKYIPKVFTNREDRCKQDKKFLEELEIASVDSQILENCIKNRKHKKIKLADNIIAATAQTRKLTLATRNINDFSGLDIDIINPFDDN